MTITENLKTIAQEEGWNIQEWKGMFRIDADSRHGTWQTFCRIMEEEKRFCYYSLCPVNVPKEKIPYLGEVLTRMNYGLKVGNFEMDYETGEIHFKTYLDFTGQEKEKPAIAQCIYSNIVTFDHYFPKLMEAIHGGQEGREAFLKSL
ncbi:MAG: YbjN domain-containing protein [Lachnospiraceae bacterium]|nr:YbjN domain-containing protein [Lachnospiraceae bacterium]